MLITPQVGHISLLKFDLAKELIELGRKAVDDARPSNRKRTGLSGVRRRALARDIFLKGRRFLLGFLNLAFDDIANRHNAYDLAAFRHRQMAHAPVGHHRH